MCAYELTVTSPGDYFITISQKDLRHYKGRINAYDPIGILLVESKGDKVTYRGGIQNMSRDNWIKSKLNPGKYFIFIKGFPTDPELDIGLSVYGPSSVNILKKGKTSLFSSFEKMISKALASKAYQLDDEWGSLSQDESNPLNKVKTFYVPSSTDGYGFKIYQNQGGQDVVIQTKGKIEAGRMIYPIATELDSEFDYVFELKSGYTQVLYWDVKDDVNIEYAEDARIGK